MVGRGVFPAYACVWLHRLSHYLHRRGRVRPARVAWHLNLLLTGADICPSADLAGGLVIPHPAGVVLAGTAGRDLTIMAQAGLHGGPILGDGVHLGAHAGVHGAVRVGNGVHVEPGCCVTTDISDHTTVDGPPPRFRSRRR